MKNNTWKIATFTLIGVLIGLLGIYIYLSPYLALRNIRQSFVNKDAETFSSYIDFPRFKENFKSELNAKLMAEMSKNAQKDKDNPFAGLGMMFAGTMVNNIVDSFVSPAGIEHMMKGDFATRPSDTTQLSPDANPFKSGLIDEEKVKVLSGYKSLNEFTVDTTDKADSNKGAQLIFERRGVTGWQLVNMKIK